MPPRELIEVVRAQPFLFLTLGVELRQDGAGGNAYIEAFSCGM